jgi:signal transduction histidine kinase
VFEVHHSHVVRNGLKFAVSDIFGSLCCLLFMVVELVVTPGLSLAGVIFIVLYSLLLICLPAKPTICCVLMAVLSAGVSLVPVTVEGPTAFWGTWFAIGVLARRERLWVSASCVALNVVASMLSAVIFDSGISLGTVGLSGSYLVSALVGFAIRKQADALQVQKEHELSQQRILFQDERLENLHVIHDQVAGDLTHIVQRCRLWLSDPTIKDDEKAEIVEVEVMVSEVLHHLRTNVIEPARKSFEQHHEHVGYVDVSQDATNSTILHEDSHVQVLGGSTDSIDEGEEDVAAKPSFKSASYDLTKQACKAQKRLAALGFSGHIDITGNRDQLTHRQITAVSRLLDELSNNIARHGKPGEYLFRVGLGSRGFGILASNLCNEQTAGSQESNGVGLRLITRTVESLGGDIQTNTEDGEWTIAIRVANDDNILSDDEQ